MAHTIRCPNGHQTLLADVFAGRTALCSVCGSIVLADGSSPPAPEMPPPPTPSNAAAQPSATPVERTLDQADQEAEQPAPPRHGFEGVYRGLGFHYFKTAGYLLATVLLSILVGIVLYLQTGPPEWVQFVAGVAIIILVLALATQLLLASLLGLIGSMLCLSAPSATRARGLILASFLLEVLPVVATGIGFLLDQVRVLEWPPPDPWTGIGPATRIAQSIGSIGGLASWTLFMLFLWQLSRHFRDRIVASEALTLIGRGWAIVGGWSVVILLCIGLAWLDAHRQQQDQSVILGAGLFVILAVILVLAASLWVLRSVLDLIGSVRHIVLARADVTE